MILAIPQRQGGSAGYRSWRTEVGYVSLCTVCDVHNMAIEVVGTQRVISQENAIGRPTKIGGSVGEAQIGGDNFGLFSCEIHRGEIEQNLLRSGPVEALGGRVRNL